MQLRTIVLAGAAVLAASRTQASPFAYVPGSITGTSIVTVIDTASDTVVTTIPVGSNSRGVALLPDGSRVYTTEVSSGNISVIDPLSNTVSSTIVLPPAPFSFPWSAAVNPAGTRLYATNDGVARVSVVNTITNAFVTDITHASLVSPQNAVVTPDGAKLYVTNAFSSDLVVIDTATNAVLTTIIGAGERGVDVHPNGSRVYAAIGGGGVSVVDTATDMQLTSIPIVNATAVRVHPDGTRLYVGSYGAVSIVDTTTLLVTTSVVAPDNHFGLDITPDGSKIYVGTLSPGQVEVRDAATLALIINIPVAGEPYATGRFIGPPTVCGNGVQEAGEACDDGNVTNGDCCSATCQLQVCNDGNACTIDSCVAPSGCVFSPPSGCRSALKSMLTLKDNATDDAKDQLLWKWQKGQSTALEDFGDPQTTADYTLCLFAGTASAVLAVASVPADGVKWQPAGSKGFKYADKLGTAAGIQKLNLKSSADDKAQVLVKGKGINLPDPGALDAVAAPLRVQLINDETAVCWESNFAPADVVKQDAKQLKAKHQD